MDYGGLSRKETLDGDDLFEHGLEGQNPRNFNKKTLQFVH
jgi:hypothetical protein